MERKSMVMIKIFIIVLIYQVKIIYFITNYLIQLFFTLVFHTQVQELHLKPVKINKRIDLTDNFYMGF